jgi:hypothetical protein
MRLVGHSQDTRESGDLIPRTANLVVDGECLVPCLPDETINRECLAEGSREAFVEIAEPSP